MDRLSTEVLIIGAGAASLRAAIACRKAGTEVLGVAKSPPGSGTATILGGGFGVGLAALSPDEQRARNLTEPPGLDFGPRFKLSYITFDKRARPPKPCRALARKPLSEKEQGSC